MTAAVCAGVFALGLLPLHAQTTTEPPPHAEQTPQPGPEIASQAGEDASAPKTGAIGPSLILTLNQDRLFEDSDYGKTTFARLQAEAQALQVEIRKIESDLEIEERLLTDRRATMPADQFAPLAAAFDEKVEKLRAAWGAKDRDIKNQREGDRKHFFDAALPVLAEMMQESGAVALLDQSTVILSLDRFDITDLAIARIDAQLAIPAEAPEPKP
ncbi:OmpH family outer membrane protein [Pseudorhodobacter sp.]|uniref:OmpH family outer membrane protein n=1 Tax=Pseudorhodobacter sp. TaxID=1934400 RepID=UPI0026488E50|nr:OmpH family outer membrane protein [Pseudorhodobacter sp.]MDN5786207.1 OmpH family outer membrane protein [Pseudorhodobacter sp.]